LGKIYQQYLREQRIEEAKKILHENNMIFYVYNNGLHFKSGDINFWPTTGKVYNQVTKERGIGINDFIKLVKGFKS